MIIVRVDAYNTFHVATPDWEQEAPSEQELLIKLRAAGRAVAEVGVPHYPRTAGSPTGAKPQVIFRAVRDFWRTRIAMWADRSAAMLRGRPIIEGDG